MKRLEEGKVPLEESVAIYERGQARRRCEELLRQAEARVDKITTDGAGQVAGLEPLDVQWHFSQKDRILPGPQRTSTSSSPPPLRGPACELNVAMLIYVQGYDPRGHRLPYRMFRTELRKFTAVSA